MPACAEKLGFIFYKKTLRKSVLLLIFASLDFFTDINNTKVCGLREIKNCLEKEMSMWTFILLGFIIVTIKSVKSRVFGNE